MVYNNNLVVRYMVSEIFCIAVNTNSRDPLLAGMFIYIKYIRIKKTP